jgi:Integral membrane protein possibly involved in chromosome condensation
MGRMSTPATYLAVAAGGALGATARFALGGAALRLLGPGFPWGTLAANVLGGFAMGVAAVLIAEKGLARSGRLAPFVMTGVLGGFTTFSAFSLDALYLMERGRGAAAALYVGGSVALSIGALWAGLSLARSL